MNIFNFYGPIYGDIIGFTNAEDDDEVENIDSGLSAAERTPINVGPISEPTPAEKPIVKPAPAEEPVIEAEPADEPASGHTHHGHHGHSHGHGGHHHSHKPEPADEPEP